MTAGPVNAVSVDDGDRSDAARTAGVKQNGVRYKCKAKSAVVNDAIGGPQQFLVNGSAKFKGSFKAGTKITPKAIRLTLVLPKKLTKKIRRDLSVKKVKGSANVKFDVKPKPGKASKMTVKGLRSGWKKVPKNKKLRIPTKGHAAKYRIPKKANKLRLFAPKRFTINAKLRPPAVGIVPKTRLNCKFNGKSRKLGNLPVR